MRSLLVVALLLAVTFAGCAEDPERYPDGVSELPSTSSTGTSTSPTSTSTSTAGSGNSSTNSTGEPVAANRAPIGNLTASLEGMVATITVEGSDPDGDALEWTLDLGDGQQANGTELPATLEHTYTEGVFTLVLVLTDGTNATQASLELTVVAGGSTALVDVTKTWTASFGGVTEFAFGCVSSGVDCAYFDLPEAAVGRTFTFTFRAAAPAALYYVDVYAGSSYEDTFIGAPGATTLSDVVPPGTTQFRTYSTGGANLSAHLLIP